MIFFFSLSLLPPITAIEEVNWIIIKRKTFTFILRHRTSLCWYDTWLYAEKKKENFSVSWSNLNFLLYLLSRQLHFPSPSNTAIFNGNEQKMMININNCEQKFRSICYVNYEFILYRYIFVYKIGFVCCSSFFGRRHLIAFSYLIVKYLIFENSHMLFLSIKHSCYLN